MTKIQFHRCFKLNGKSFSEVTALFNFSKTVSEEVYNFLKIWFDESKFVEVKTSGSTGKPKVIQLKKEFMKNSALATGTFFKLKENTTALLCMSPNYIAGKMMLVRALELGWHIDIVEPTSNPLKKIDKTYDFSAMVPLQLNNCLNELDKVKKLIVGGGVVSKELLQKIQHIKTEVFATYGMTETITHIAVKKLNNFTNIIARETAQCQKVTLKNSEVPSRVGNDDDGCFGDSGNDDILRHAELVLASHYQILPNVSISQDSRNCLVIKAPKVSSEVIVTNDIVKLYSEKEFDWLGRFDTIINSGGIKLIPEQIEEKLSVIIKERFFVYGIADEVLGEKLVLIVEGFKNDVILNNVQHLKSLSKFEQPKEIIFIPEFSETETQKINRKKTIQLL